MTLHVRAIVVALFLALAAVPAASQPAPQARQDAGAPGIIRGRITAADTGRPLRRARVSIYAVTAVGQPTTAGVTNAQGMFELRDVPAGSYYVSATRAGYIAVQHGQRRPRDRGMAIDVKSGQTVERIDIALPRGSVVAGCITDERGEPYPGVRVSALDVRYQNGRRILFPVGTTLTDDVGQYRISGLQPGSFYVSAMSAETWLNEKKETLGYAATYYPGVAADTAQTITLGVSQQRVDIDFALSAVRTVRISGRALRATGEPLASESVTLRRSIGNGAVMVDGAIQGRTTADGSFELRNVAPADYVLGAGGSGETARLDLSVREADINNLVIVTRTGSTVTGNVVTVDGGAPPFPASGIRLFLITDSDNVLPTVRVPAVNRDWTFRMTSVGGPFVFRIRGLPEDWMLEAVKLGDRDITDTIWDVPTGGQEITDLQFVLTQRVGRISGDVSTADGKPTADATVVLFSEDASLWMPGSRFVQSTRPSSSGQFSFTALPAGSYLAVAKDFIVDGQWENREFLEGIRKDAVRVLLDAGGSRTVSLKVMPAR